MEKWVQALWAIPIIPWLGWKWISASTIGKIPKFIDDGVEDKFREWNNKDMELLEWALWKKKNPPEWTESWSKSMILTKPKETKEAFIKQVTQNNNTDYVKAFSESLNTSWDKTAKQTFSGLSPSDQWLETWKFIESLEESEKKNLNRDNLIKQILEPQLTTIKNTTDEAQKQTLLQSLKNQIDTTLWGADKVKWVFANNAEDKDLLDKLFSQNRSSTTGQQTPSP